LDGRWVIHHRTFTPSNARKQAGGRVSGAVRCFG
jgi:hypothetical protein